MKTLRLIIGILFVALYAKGERMSIVPSAETLSGSDSARYTTTKNYRVERKYIDSTRGNTPARSVCNVTYLDGFGRKVQEVALHASPGGGGDIVVPCVYGSFGRIEKEYIPYAKTGNDGRYVENAFAASNWNFYGTAEADCAYTRMEYDGTPFNRMVKQTGPGRAWHVAKKGMTVAYHLNRANEVRRYRVTAGGTLTMDGYYDAGTLKKRVMTDEDGHCTEVFTDNRGYSVLTVDVKEDARLETYGIYDDRGLLRYVLSPEASSQLGNSINEAVLQNLAYRYDYDRRKRLVVKRLPGCAPVYFVYDRRDRLVMSQNGKQRAADVKKWSYSLYDGQSRVVETGEVVLPVATAHAALQTTASASDCYVPTGVKTAFQRILYDTYTGTPAVPVHPFAATPGYTSAPHTPVTGLVTSVSRRVFGKTPETWLTTTTYYDDHCRAIQRVSDNIHGYKSKYDIKYDFAGNVTGMREAHTISSTQTDILEIFYEYDERGRLLSASTRLNGGIPAQVRYAYDAMGRLASKQYGNLKETMSYNLRGWLTSRESSVFKMKLRYEAPVSETTACWNGNISEWEWQHGVAAPMMYAFAYDKLNRLTGSSHYQKTGNLWNRLTGNQAFEENRLQYDRNGNIQTLTRTGTSAAAMTYSYTGNQLTGLVRNGNAGTYQYDENGNLTNDSRRNLKLAYNLLDLLSEVRTGSGTVKAKYYYLADGTKLGVDDGKGNGFYHTGSLIYLKENNTVHLSSGLFDGGRIVADGTSRVGNQVRYFVKDHLGSVRVIVDHSGNVCERNNYYPFGQRYAVSGGSVDAGSLWKYNGQEEQVTGGLGWLDYGYRMYDSDLCRWWVPDPLSENHYAHSPWAYVLNNPINYTDYLGLDNIPENDVDWHNFDPDKDVIELDEATVTPDGEEEGGLSSAALFHASRHNNYGALSKARIDWDVSSHNRALDVLQTLLDLAGLIPVFGEVFDGANALIYCVRGDYVSASLSAVAMMPFVGIGATGAKVVNKGLGVFIKGSFRKNLIRLTGIDPGKGMQAHHVFPQKFRKRFKNLGINVDDPSFGSWWETTTHQKNSYKYNESWSEFWDKGPTQEKAFLKARELGSEYGYTLNF